MIDKFLNEGGRTWENNFFWPLVIIPAFSTSLMYDNLLLWWCGDSPIIDSIPVTNLILQGLTKDVDLMTEIGGWPRSDDRRQAHNPVCWRMSTESSCHSYTTFYFVQKISLNTITLQTKIDPTLQVIPKSFMGYGINELKAQSQLDATKKKTKTCSWSCLSQKTITTTEWW